MQVPEQADTKEYEMGPQTRRTSATGTSNGVGQGRAPGVWQVLSALFLLAMAGIHIYLVFTGFDGLLGTLFVLNGIGGVVLAVAIVLAPRRFLPVVSVLSLLFMLGTLAGLVLALTVGLFGISEQLGGTLVVPTLVVESIGVIVLAVTSASAFRARR